MLAANYTDDQVRALPIRVYSGGAVVELQSGGVSIVVRRSLRPGVLWTGGGLCTSLYKPDGFKDTGYCGWDSSDSGLSDLDRSLLFVEGRGSEEEPS